MQLSENSRLQLILPEFSEHRAVTWDFFVDNTSTENGMKYDMILGRDFLSAFQIDMLFSENIIRWDGLQMDMRRPSQLTSREDDLNIMLNDKMESKVTKEATRRTMEILDAKYEKANIQEEIKKQTHLNDAQKHLLMKLLQKYESLFDGTLGEWNLPPVDLELKEGTEPFCSRAFPVPKIHEETLRKEIARLIEIGVLVEDSDSEFGSPTFVLPKKDRTVRFVSDFRKLNQSLKRKPYPIPNISDLLQKLEGFTYATALDLNMGYYHIKLSLDASKKCTIVTPWGKYRYTRLPMGISVAADIFQNNIYNLLGKLDYVRAYIDDVLVLTKGSFEDHLEKLDEVFRRLQEAGLKCKMQKSEFAKKKLYYLGYIISTDGISPDPKKVEAILNIDRPKTVKDVRRLLGMIQYYRDVWPKRSEILAPLTNLIGGKNGPKKRAPVKWTKECEEAFVKIKAVIAKETLLAYPDFSKKFTIYTDASDTQLGAVIMQDGKPLAFYSRKLNKSQLNYTVTEKELLSIVETLKEFRNILLGYEIEVYTDHINLTYNPQQSDSQRVQRWRLIIEEFGPILKYIKGEANIVADALSRMPSTELDEEKQELHLAELLDIEARSDAFPLDYKTVRKEQQREIRANQKLAQLIEKSEDFGSSTYDDVDLITYKNRMYVPQILRQRTLTWYHYMLCHPGGSRLANTIGTAASWPGIHNHAAQFCKKCKICQKFKKRSQKYSELPPKTIEIPQPWHTVAVDLIGPYKINAKQLQTDNTIKKKELKLCAMTFVDLATGWFEIAEIPWVDYLELEIVINKSKKDEAYLTRAVNKESVDKSSARISQIFNNVWLSRYPRPTKVIFDNGSEFKKSFIDLLQDYAVKPIPTSIKNPQSNAIIERIHQVVHNMMRTQDLKGRVFDPVDPWSEILASVAYAVRSSYHRTLEATPAQLVFGRDMLFNIAHVADWQEIQNKKRKQVERDNQRENNKRTKHTYEVGQKALLVPEGVQRKYEWMHEGPFEIRGIHDNGTVTIKRGRYLERLNVRRLTPYFE